MKTIVLKMTMVALFLLLIETGCEKDDPGYDPNSIIGEWEWLYSVNGDLTASYSYPENGQSLTIEFGQDKDLIFRENGNINNKTSFSISGDTLSYNENIEKIYVFNINEDTLKLKNIFTLGDYSFYKRIK